MSLRDLTCTPELFLNNETKYIIGNKMLHGCLPILKGLRIEKMSISKLLLKEIECNQSKCHTKHSLEAVCKKKTLLQ